MFTDAAQIREAERLIESHKRVRAELGPRGRLIDDDFSGSPSLYSLHPGEYDREYDRHTEAILVLEKRISQGAFSIATAGATT